MEPLLLVILFATLTELIIEAVKPALQPLFSRLPIPPDVDPYLYLSLALGVALAFMYQADLLTALGMTEATSPLSITITGLFVGRGANFIHDVIARLSNPA